MKTATILLSICCSSAALLLPADAAIITFKEGANVVSSDSAINIPSYAGTQDTSVVQESPNNNFGGRTTILVGVLGSGRVRAGHVRYDLSSLAGQYSSIDSMTFRFHVDATSGAADSQTMGFGAHKAVSGSWVEGTENAVPQTGSASYNYQVDDTLHWGVVSNGGRQGGDAWNHGGLAVSGSGYGEAGTWIEMTIDPSAYDAPLNTLTGLVDSWIADGPLNDGILMTYGSPVSNPQWQLASSESTTAANRPELVLEYTVIPEPASLALLGLGGLALILRRRK